MNDHMIVHGKQQIMIIKQVRLQQKAYLHNYLMGHMVFVLFALLDQDMMQNFVLNFILQMKWHTFTHYFK
jgi:hypothetical protein